MIFYTQYDRPDKAQFLESGGGKVLVDRAGYIPVARRIHDIIEAGLKLRISRIQEYHFESEEAVDEYFTDFGLEPGFDMAEASQMLLGLKERARQRAKDKVNEGNQPVESPAASPAPSAPSAPNS